MTEYIEKQAEYCDKEIVKEAIGMIANACLANPRITCGEIQTFFKGIPTADVRPVVRGRWVDEHVYKQTMSGKTYDGFTYCSNCKQDFSFGYRSKFCPNCGSYNGW